MILGQVTVNFTVCQDGAHDSDRNEHTFAPSLPWPSVVVVTTYLDPPTLQSSNCFP